MDFKMQNKYATEQLRVRIGRVVIWAMITLMVLFVVIAGAQRIDGLVLWWEFREPGGLIVYDQSPALNNGVFASGNATRVFDPLRGWVIQTGSAAFASINAANSSELNFGTGNFTVTFWIKNPSPSSDAFILGKSNYAGSDNGIYFYTTASIDRYYNGSADILLGASTSNWKHIGLVRSGTGITPYANGVALTGGTDSRTLSNSLSVTLGTSSDSAPFCGGCGFSDVRMYGLALSAGEIAQVMGYNSIGKVDGNLVGVIGSIPKTVNTKGSLFNFFPIP